MATVIKNNINLLKDYFQKDQPGILFINRISEEINIFYSFVIEYFIKKNKINLIKDNLSFNIYKDLFNTKEIYLFSDCKAKDIELILSKDINAILFTDYKNYKKFSSNTNYFSSYYYINDIKFFIQEELNVNEQELISYCILNPYLIFSEISKYLVNQNYTKEIFDKKKLNPIYDVRKKIFDLKNSKNKVQEIYLELKNEAQLKKLNFLTY